jgi:hypothetical protein
MSFGCQGARSRAGAGCWEARPSLDRPCSARPHPARTRPDTASSPGMHARFVTRARSRSRAGVSGRADRWRCGREAGLRACARRAKGPPRSRHQHHTLARRVSIPPPSSGPDVGHARVASRPRKRQHPPGLFRCAGKRQETLPARDPRATAVLGARRAQMARPRAGAGQPWRIQASGGSVSRGGRCWQSHQVPPGQSS